MSEPFVGEIRAFVGSDSPEGWLLCQGQLLNISDYPELFAAIGDQFGGDGRTTFALPALRGTEAPSSNSSAAAGAGPATTFIIAVASRAPQDAERRVRPVPGQPPDHAQTN